MPNNNHIWCPKIEGQKNIQVCARCKEKDTCEEYQNHSQVVVRDKKKAIVLDEQIEAMKNTIFDTYFDLGLALKEMRDQRLFREFGYKNLEDYAQQRHGFMYRKAAYLIAIVENCDKAGLKRQDVRGIEWSKMACLPELTDKNRQKWLSKAKDMSVEALKTEVKKDKGEKPTEEKKFLSFALSESQKGVVDMAFDLAAKLTDSKVKSYHLQVLAEEFIATYGTMDDASVARFQSVYGEEGSPNEEKEETVDES